MSENRASRESTYRGDWATPWKDFYSIQDVGYPFALDVAAGPENAKCLVFYTATDNALTQRWAVPRGKFWWCNPDFRLASEFLDKAYEQMHAGYPGIMLLPPNIEQGWFKLGITARGIRILLFPRRIHFIDPTADKRQSNTKGSILAAFTQQKKLPRVEGQPWWSVCE
jgi:phage N-6-adenine-methyltransferase